MEHQIYTRDHPLPSQNTHGTPVYSDIQKERRPTKSVLPVLHTFYNIGVREHATCLAAFLALSSTVAHSVSTLWVSRTGALPKPQNKKRYVPFALSRRTEHTPLLEKEEQSNPPKFRDWKESQVKLATYPGRTNHKCSVVSK